MDLNKPIIIKTVNRLLHQAIAEGVTSLHCEFSHAGDLSVWQSRFGELKEVANFSQPLADGIKDYLRGILKWSTGSVAEPKNISITTDSGQITLQASGLAAKNSEKIVLNLKPTGGEIIPLDSLGLNNEHLELLRSAMIMNGLVIITGPSNAGKTTTAYAILSALNAGKTNVYAVEEVISQDLPGINQLSRPKGVSWSMLFRTLTKQDADIIYLDLNDSLPPAHELSLLATKKLVIINLEADSIGECLEKLNLGSGTAKINLIINQALVRQLCHYCAFSYILDQPTFDELVKDFGSLDQDLIGLELYHNTGCEICHHSGYIGHLGLFAMLAPSAGLKQLLIQEGLSTAVQTKINEEINLSILEDGFVKALQGLITVEELRKSC